jgi:hypothetical protein
LIEAAAWVEAAARVEAAAGPGAEAAAALEDAEGATALTTDCLHLCDTRVYIPSLFFYCKQKKIIKTAGLRAINKYKYNTYRSGVDWIYDWVPGNEKKNAGVPVAGLL